MIAKRLALLGFVHSITWDDGEDTRAEEWPDPDDGGSGIAALCCNAKGTAIYFLPYDQVEEFDIEGYPGKVAQTFEDWSGFEANEAVKIEIPEDRLFLIGVIKSICYHSDKWVGENRLYVHDFDNPPKLYHDGTEDPASWGILDEGGARLVCDRGIIG